jgi:hypothetical protein
MSSGNTLPILIPSRCLSTDLLQEPPPRLLLHPHAGQPCDDSQESGTKRTLPSLARLEEEQSTLAC